MHFSKIFFPILGIIFCISYLEAQKKSDISTINDYSHEKLRKHPKKHTKNFRKLMKLDAVDKYGKTVSGTKYSEGNDSSASDIDHTEEMLEENGTSI